MKNHTLILLAIFFINYSFSQNIEELNKKELKILAQKQKVLIDSLNNVISQLEQKNTKLSNSLTTTSNELKKIKQSNSNKINSLKEELSTEKKNVKTLMSINSDLTDMAYDLIYPQSKSDLLTDSGPNFMLGTYEGMWEFSEKEENTWTIDSFDQLVGVSIAITAVRGDIVYGYCTGFYSDDTNHSLTGTDTRTRLIIGKAKYLPYDTTCGIAYNVSFNIPGYTATIELTFEGAKDEEETNYGPKCIGQYYAYSAYGKWIYKNGVERSLKLEPSKY